MEENNKWLSLSQILECKINGDCSIFRIKTNIEENLIKDNLTKKQVNDIDLSNNIVSNDKIFDTSLKESLKKIFALDCDLLDKSTCLILIRNHINTIHDFGNSAIVDVANNALRVLDNIEVTENLIYGNYGICDLLIKILNFCFKYSPNTKTIVIHELANCIENNNIVCLKGQVQRLVNSLNGVIENIGTKNKNSLNEEMMNKASAISKKIYNKLSKRAKRIIDESKNKDPKQQNNKNSDLNIDSDSDEDNDIILYYETTVKKKNKKKI
jgi:hypothetical protein